MAILTSSRKLLLFSALSTAWLLLTVIIGHATEINLSKKVLILNSYHSGYKGSDSMVDGFRDTLMRELPEGQIQIEYLDSIHFSGKEFDDKILDLLRFKYQQHKFDLIFSTDDYAFNILEKHRDDIFGATPVVFCGTNSFDSSRLIGKQGFNGIDERPSFGATLNLIFRLHPGTSNVVVIHDTGVTGQRNSEEFRSEAIRFGNRARFSYLAGEHMEDLTRKVKELQPGSVIVYFATHVEDHHGERIPTGDAQQMLDAVSRVPIYGGWEFLLGKGMVGGRLLNLRQHGTLAAQMAIKVLRNESPGSIAKFSPSPNQFMFDYDQMSRFNIRESQLPVSSFVINKPPGFLKTYKVALLSTLCGALLLALFSILAKLLKSRKELSASLADLQEAQSELMATARKAGMTEIAINMLHNVGNVLNSVNISAGVLSGMVRDSKTQRLAQTVQLLKEHSGELDQYLTCDEKGKLLPGYLEKLSETLITEQQEIRKELSQLTRSVDHIKDIVASQRSHVGAASVIEPVLVAELVKDALHYNAESLELHKVTVVEEVAEMQVLQLDKARVLQILVNLISNASHAMEGKELEAGAANRLTLSAELSGAGRLRISVADEGMGIAPENLSRIFSHGFTTRRRGNGFGLHSCALAASDMGGTLKVSSAGVGKGATFVLELPTGVAGKG